MRRSDVLVVGWASLPVFLSGLAMLGFACGIAIGKWHAPLALMLSMGLIGLLAREDEPKAILKTILLFLAGVMASVVLAGLFVLYMNADAAAYHRPATVLLANGWNPLKMTEVDQVRGMMGGGFQPWHVCFLPRMGWIFGAAFYKWFGFVEVSDAVGVLLFMASFLSVLNWLSGMGKDSVRWSLLICVSPVVASGLLDGSLDSALYSALLIAVTAASDRKWLTLSLGVIVMGGLKFTGVVVGALAFAYGGLVVLMGRESVKERMALFRRLFSVGVFTGVMIFLVNATPYLTSFKNHGGPFYPAHSFDRAERFEDAKNPITYDFSFMNDDAREVGYFGRLAWAYGSQSLCKAYYRWRLDRSSFSPDFKVGGGVGGFGALFRVAFWLSLLAWPFIRNRKINLLMGMIIVSVLIQPTIYSGYARYVPQFYLFPILALLGISERLSETRCARVMSLMVGCGYAMALLIYPLSFFALRWIISVQNLQIIDAARKCGGTVMVAGDLSTRHAFKYDLGCRDVRTKSGKFAQGETYDCSYFGFCQLKIPGGVPQLYALRHQISNNDVKIKASRNANMVRFFLKDFLPRESMRIPLRLWQTARLRLSQVKIWRSELWEG